MPLPEQAPAARPTSGKTVMSWHWLVIARLLRARDRVAALPQSGDVAGRRVGEDARPVDDLRVLRRRERHLDHVDAEERVFGSSFAFGARAAGQLLARSHRARAGSVDVEVGLVVRDR